MFGPVRMNHPNILAVFDIGEDNGSPYIVSELLEGEPLRERLKGGPLPVLEWRPADEPVQRGDAIYAVGVAGASKPTILEGRVGGKQRASPQVP